MGWLIDPYMSALIVLHSRGALGKAIYELWVSWLAHEAASSAFYYDTDVLQPLVSPRRLRRRASLELDMFGFC